jgi:hypothetical protein
MTVEARIFVAGLGLLFLLVVLRAVRGHRLQFEFALPWMTLSLVLVLAAVFQKSADRVARWVGIDYPPAFFFLVCLFVVLLLLFQLSLRLSVLGDRQRRLAQETAVRGALLDAGGLGEGATGASAGTAASAGESARAHGTQDAGRET